MSEYICKICKKQVDEGEVYEYRGVYSCEDHFDDLIKLRDFERNEVIWIESSKTECFRGLDLDPDSTVGKANRSILKKQIEISKKESAQLRDYERKL